MGHLAQHSTWADPGFGKGGSSRVLGDGSSPVGFRHSAGPLHRQLSLKKQPHGVNISLCVQYRTKAVPEASSDVVDSSRLSTTSVRIHKLKTYSHCDSDTRFPKLDECAHFHYENVELQQAEVCLFNES